MITHQIMREPPSRSRKGSKISEFRRKNILQHRLSIVRNKIPRNSSPHVGYLRHAPVASKNMRLQRIDLREFHKTLHAKSCPYVGFIRHAPPASMNRLQRKTKRNQNNNVCCGGNCFKEHICTEESILNKHKYVLRDGLPGGSPMHDSSYSICRWFEASSSSELFSFGPPECSARRKDSSLNLNPLATLDTLNNLAYWFLFPIANDHESMLSCCKNHDNALAEMRLGLTFIRPFLTSLLKKIFGNDHADFSNSLGTPAFEESSASSSLQSIDYADKKSSSLSTVEEIMLQTSTTRVYHHPELQREELFQSISTIDSQEIISSQHRHLDIESILRLPTMTFDDGSSLEHNDTRPGMDIPTSDATNEKLEWSWISVPKDPSCESLMSMTDEHGSHNQNHEDNHCVICLEHFQHGDRLRILPCNHRFHTSCIDKWLSGSFSYDECYTGLCPTCKAAPTLDEDDSMESMNLDGSVPAWAFARLGSRIAE